LVPQRIYSTAGPGLCLHSETAPPTVQDNAEETSSEAGGTDSQPTINGHPALSSVYSIIIIIHENIKTFWTHCMA